MQNTNQDSSNNVDVQVVTTTPTNNTVASTEVANPVHDQAKDVSSAITVTGMAMVGIFGFMFIFFLVIKAIDKLFPHKE